MALPVVAVATVLGFIAIPIVTKVLFGLGFGFMAYHGLTTLYDAAFADIMSNLGDLPSTVFQLLAIAKIDVAITMIASAYSARLGLMGVTASGVLTRFMARGIEDA